MKYISKMLPACGFVIAVALVGITSAFKDAPKNTSGFQTYSFEYQPPTSPNPYSEANVENESNWQYNASATQCGGAAKACSILSVPSTYVNTGGTPTLMSTLNITAVEDDPGIAHVVSTAASSAVISNQD